MLNVALRCFEVDRVEADRPRFEPAPVAPAMDDLERRKVEVGWFCSICWLARREGTGDRGAGRELEREEARERPLPMKAAERLAVDRGRSLTMGVEDPSLVPDLPAASAECWEGVEEVGVRSWIEAGSVSVELSWACSLRGEQ